jgi:crotonobetainyl-CoA:carnitine CoA-transferase CaiB-like acyl-CoA transferase
MTADTLPLTGVRVADFTWFGAGPIYTQVLANHGAQVIRVESQAHIDGLRLAHPMPEGKYTWNVSGYYNNFNASKLSFALNMKHPKALAVALRLIAVSDIVAENYTPGTLERWGLTHDAMLAVKPDIILVHEPMQGAGGPHGDFGGFGFVITPLAGLSHLSGFRHREPVGLGTNYTDYVINPGHAVIATLAALRFRNRTGKGQVIEVAQVESSICAVSTAILDYTANGRVGTRQGNRLEHAAPHGVYRCAADPPDADWCAIAAFTDDEWQALRRAMGDPDWAQEERFATLHGRKENEDELDLLVGGWTALHSAETVMETLQAAGVPAGVVQSARDVLENDPHLRARGFYVYQEHAEAGRTAYDSPGFRLSKTPGRPLSPAPLLGEHTAQVCADVLGMDDEEMAQLVMESVLF